MLSEGQRNDINYAIPVLEHIDIEGSNVLADRGYDSNQLLDYIYERGGEPTIPSRKGAKFERHCDWWLYKERHLVEKYFLKLKGFRRIATRYDISTHALTEGDPSVMHQACFVMYFNSRPHGGRP